MYFKHYYMFTYLKTPTINQVMELKNRAKFYRSNVSWRPVKSDSFDIFVRNSNFSYFCWFFKPNYNIRIKYERNSMLSRVSTKWLNLLRKICAIFAQIFFCELLRYFWNAMSFALFFCALCAKPEIFFAKVAHETKF